MFVTCFYAILDPKSATLSYANAGHDLPYLHRNGEAEELRARGMPLGLMPGMSYEGGRVSLERDGCVLFYSDGLVEAHDPQGECSAFRSFERSSPSTVRRDRLGLALGGALLLRWRGLGAGGRHHPPYATALCASELNFGELRYGEVRRILLPRTPVNKGLVATDMKSVA